MIIVFLPFIMKLGKGLCCTGFGLCEIMSNGQCDFQTIYNGFSCGCQIATTDIRRGMSLKVPLIKVSSNSQSDHQYVRS